MDQLIPIINELHDVFSRVNIPLSKNIELPQIAVVGSQSSGKSSVLEALVGKDFLPRGSGIVTRRPLILQLNQIFPKDGIAPLEYGEFLHKPGVKFTNFADITREIEAETDNIAGTSKNISPVPITLKVFSPDVVTLTLIDLPGLVRNAVGDQPKDIDKQILAMVMEYVKQPNTIILAVHPANADLATSDGLQVAQRVDKEGTRTLGVLTKLDLMDPGTDASEILEGRTIKMRRGFIGVVNRGQRDLDSKKPVAEARRDEMMFFKTHQVYTRFAERCGTEYLARTLSGMLLTSIREMLPTLRTKIDELLKLATAEVEKYGAVMGNTQAALLEHLTSYANDVSSSIHGTYHDTPKNELYGGARINYIFHDRFVPYLNTISPTKDLTDDEIRTAISNSHGVRTHLFPSEQAFEILVTQQIRRLEAPIMRCISFVYDELVRIAEQCATSRDRYPTLRQKIFEVTSELIRSYRPNAEEHLRNLILSECGYINTNHPDFGDFTTLASKAMVETAANPTPPISAPPSQKALGGANPQTASSLQVQQQQQTPTTPAANRPLQTMQQNQHCKFEEITTSISQTGPLSDKESAVHRTMRNLIEAYFKVVRKTLQDLTPKVVTHFMIKSLADNLRNYLIEHLYSAEADLLKESDDVQTRRKAANEMHKALTAAKAVLNKVRDARLS